MLNINHFNSTTPQFALALSALLVAQCLPALAKPSPNYEPEMKQAVHFHLSLADLLDRSGRKLPSVQQRRFAVALDPTNVKLRVNLAEYLAQELYDIETAISEYEQAVALVPAVQTTPLCTRAASLRRVLANQRSDLGIGLLSWLRNQNTPLTNFWTSLYEGQMRERLQAGLGRSMPAPLQ